MHAAGWRATGIVLALSVAVSDCASAGTVVVLAPTCRSRPAMNRRPTRGEPARAAADPTRTRWRSAPRSRCARTLASISTWHASRRPRRRQRDPPRNLTAWSRARPRRAPSPETEGFDAEVTGHRDQAEVPTVVVTVVTGPTGPASTGRHRSRALLGAMRPATRPRRPRGLRCRGSGPWAAARTSPRKAWTAAKNGTLAPAGARGLSGGGTARLPRRRRHDDAIAHGAYASSTKAGRCLISATRRSRASIATTRRRCTTS